MKKITINSIIIVALLTLTSTFYIFGVVAYPGDGDCSTYHGITYIDVPIISNSEITLDGIPSEDFWSEPTEILLAEIELPGVIPELYSLNISFVRNNEYLYIFCQWEDNSPRDDNPPEQDGIAFCWDIDTVNFSAYYVSDMNTIHMGNGSVDAWRWFYQDIISPGEVHLCVDDCFNEDGWVQGNPEAKNIDVAFTNDSSSYKLEMRRKLNSNEIYDVQFTEKKIYKFNIAVLNNDHDEKHAISWTYALDLRESEQIIWGFNFEMFISSLFILTFVIYIYMIKTKKRY
ncbi:MAG: hypothetical protein EU552_01680 [Promethearchaeota archaeon]|nr:MAG: hypothetical protein EU552_01680 [Candidatus Lokiarchaeota archaeon]